MNQHPDITLRKGIHNNQNVVCIDFAYYQQEVLPSTGTATWLIENIKKGIRHSVTRVCCRLRKLKEQTDSLQFNKINS